jgi:hypothetical protein
MAGKDSEKKDPNEELLKRIRQRYRYGMDKWRHNRDEGQKNIKYVSGDPWTDEDKQARKGRPTVCPDELNQYVNQVVNTARQNPRGVKIDPAGGDATMELAEYRENRIRAIEYACNASRVYIGGLQGAVERNVGYWKVSRVFVDDDSSEQEIVILPIQNPDAILIDPDYKELDGSDIKWAFELERIPLEEFEHEYPDAEKRSFSADDFGQDAEYWLDSKSILIASYWEVKTAYKKVGKGSRQKAQRTVRQYITNGVEILMTGDVQPGPYIPIVPVFGKELWVSADGGSAERVLISLVSLARDPQKALAYVMSSMLENVGQIPKASWVGYKGQFDSDADAWASVNQVYHPILQADPLTDPTSGQLLPLPQRVQLTPDFQAYSVGADICRRAIQSAMGVNALPTAAQRQNQKSGVALEKIQTEQNIGSYHLVDSYDSAIKLTGRIICDWLPESDLGETQRAIRQEDGKHKLVKINTDEPVSEENDPSQTYHLPIADDKGRYQVTISSGPSHESQREEASEFVDTLVQNLKDLPLSPQQALEVLALGIRQKQLGPLGDQMADILSPQGQTAQMGQQLGQLQQQMAQFKQQGEAQQALIQKLMLERQGKVVENQGKMALEKIKGAAVLSEANMDRETKIAVAEISTKAQIESERQQSYEELQQQFHDQAHETALQAQQQGHEQNMQQAAAAQQAAMQAQPGGPGEASPQPGGEPSPSPPAPQV